VDPIPEVAQDALRWLELVGTVAFAVSGGMVAVRARMDWLGVVVLAVVASIGGGTLRDLLLGLAPVWWISRPWPVLVALLTALVVVVAATRYPQTRPDSWRTVLIADAAGLAAFTTTGTLIALDAGVAPGMAALLGVITGTAGGVVRDLLARQRPLLLVGQIYALAAAAGAVLLVAVEALGAARYVAQWASIAVILLLRVAAIKYRWSLPRFQPVEQQ
jgi:uncharacterized membrane protein YeiH